MIRDECDMPRDSDGSLSRYAWPGGYEIAYITDDGGILCQPCAERDGSTDPGDSGTGWYIVGFTHDGEMESPEICDHCGYVINEEGEG